MTYGLRNASQTFQRQIFRTLGDLEFVFAFIDDIFIASETPEEQRHLRTVFQRLKQFCLRLNVEKCLFGMRELEFLGFTINSEGCKPTPKVQAIQEYPKPRTIVELRRFLELINFYRKFLRDATHQSPLNTCVTKKKKREFA